MANYLGFDPSSLSEGIAGVSQPKGKAENFKHPKGSDDSRLGNVLGGHGDLIVPFCRSNLEKIVEQAIPDVKSAI